MIFLDTHVVAWLYAGRIERFPRAALEFLEGGQISISPMAGLELQYLYEIQRLTEPGFTVIADLEKRIGLTVADVSLAEITALAHDVSWTRDPFDRLIVAQAMFHEARLLTADRIILENYEHACWD